MEKFNLIFPSIAAVIFVWAATAYHYVNTGASIGLWMLLLFILWFVWKKPGLQAWKFPQYLIPAMVILYGGIILSTCFHMNDMKNWSGGYYSVVGFLRCTLPFFALWMVGRIRDVRKPVFWTLTAIIYAICLFSLYQIIITHGGRPVSFYRTPHVTTMVLTLMLPFSAAFGVYYFNNSLYKWVSWCVIPFAFIVLYFADVRGAIMGVVGAGIVCGIPLYIQFRKRISAKKLCLLVLAFFAVGSILLGQAIEGGWNRSGEIRVGDRYYMWEASYQIWQDHPIAGVGINNWMKTYESEKYYPPQAKEHGHDHPHNVFVYFFASAGVIGGAAYIMYCLSMLAVFVTWIRKKAEDPMAWAILFAFIAMTVQGMVDCNFIFKLVARTFYMLLAAALVFSLWREKDRIVSGEKSIKKDQETGV